MARSTAIIGGGLERVRLYEEPRSAADFGLEEDALPAIARAHVIRVAGRRNGTAAGRPEGEPPSPLDRLTAAMDAAREEGRVTDEAIDAVVRKFRAGRPYGRALSGPTTSAEPKGSLLRRPSSC